MSEHQKLTDQELQTLEYSFFSLNEEIDLFYAKQKQKTFVEENITMQVDDNKLHEVVAHLLDTLESRHPDCEDWKDAL